MAQQAQVLIVDSESDTLGSTAEALREAGYDVFSTNQPQTAVETARKIVPAVVVLNVLPKDERAAEISHEIRSNPNLSGIKVVHVCTPPTEHSGSTGNGNNADCTLTSPVTPQTLQVTVEAMLRLKQAEDQLRRSEQLWQMVFAKSREATILVDSDLRILEANPKASELFNCTIDELKEMRFLQLCSDAAQKIVSDRLRLATLGYAMVLQAEFIRQNGSTFPAEIQARLFKIDSQNHFEIIIRNLDDDLSVEFASRAMSRELDLLTAYSSQDSPSVTAALYAGGPVSQLMPAYFEELADSYSSIVDLALEEKRYQVDHGLPEQLCLLAGRLGRLRATPRDVVELHTTVLKRKMAASNPRKKQAYNVEGRFILIELLGYLATYYRDRAVGSLLNGSRQ